jgi:hypothetical protein
MSEQSNLIIKGAYKAEFIAMPKDVTDDDVSFAYAVVEPPYEGGGDFYEAYVHPLVKVEDVVTTATKKVVRLTVAEDEQTGVTDHEHRLTLAREGIADVISKFDEIEKGIFKGF